MNFIYPDIDDDTLPNKVGCYDKNDENNLINALKAFTKFTPAELTVDKVEFYKQEKGSCQWIVHYSKMDNTTCDVRELRQWHNLIKEPFDVTKSSIRVTQTGIIVIYNIVICTCMS